MHRENTDNGKWQKHEKGNRIYPYIFTIYECNIKIKTKMSKDNVFGKIEQICEIHIFQLGHSTICR